MLCTSIRYLLNKYFKYSEHYKCLTLYTIYISYLHINVIFKFITDTFVFSLVYLFLKYFSI